MKKRSVQAEQLDNLSLDGPILNGALQSLAWVNKWFGNQRLLTKTVLKIIEQYPEQKHFEIIDLGCGGGDILRKMAATLHQNNIQFSMTGIDGNPHALQYAREQGKNLSAITYQQADILDGQFELPTCDILISSHFIYHF